VPENVPVFVPLGRPEIPLHIAVSIGLSGSLSSLNELSRPLLALLASPFESELRSIDALSWTNPVTFVTVVTGLIGVISAPILIGVLVGTRLVDLEGEEGDRGKKSDFCSSGWDRDAWLGVGQRRLSGVLLAVFRLVDSEFWDGEDE
jgi:hypothetical protein